MLHRFFTSSVIVSMTALSLSGCSISDYFFWEKEAPIAIETPLISGEVSGGSSDFSHTTQSADNAAENVADKSLVEGERKERASILAKRADYLATNNEYREAA
jgi:hypothetical protein